MIIIISDEHLGINEKLLVTNYNISVSVALNINIDININIMLMIC